MEELRIEAAEDYPADGMIQVEYLGHMGDDLMVVNAARVSFDKWKNRFDDRDARLIRYLAQHGHWSPFAHPQLSFRITAPIFVARQLAKHQVGASWNEVSRRYVDEPPTCYIPRVWRKRSPSAKQGSLPESIDEPAQADNELFISYAIAERVYQRLLDLGVCPEQARMVLPQGMLTRWIWTGSLMFFARVVRQRKDEHSQAETRQVAELIEQRIAELGAFTHSWEALTS